MAEEQYTTVQVGDRKFKMEGGPLGLQEAKDFTKFLDKCDQILHFEGKAVERLQHLCQDYLADLPRHEASIPEKFTQMFNKVLGKKTQDYERICGVNRNPEVLEKMNSKYGIVSQAVNSALEDLEEAEVAFGQCRSIWTQVEVTNYKEGHQLHVEEVVGLALLTNHWQRVVSCSRNELSAD